MKILFIVSIILFYISYGITFIVEKRERSEIYVPQGIIILNYTITFLCLILPAISLCYLFDISWYWLVIINFIASRIIPYPIAIIYCFLFGIKTKPQFNYITEKFGKQHLYEYDELLTFVIAIVLFIIALVF